jgi:hypothetical protein
MRRFAPKKKTLAAWRSGFNLLLSSLQKTKTSSVAAWLKTGGLGRPLGDRRGVSL